MHFLSYFGKTLFTAVYVHCFLVWIAIHNSKCLILLHKNVDLYDSKVVKLPIWGYLTSYNPSNNKLKYFAIDLRSSGRLDATLRKPDNWLYRFNQVGSKVMRWKFFQASSQAIEQAGKGQSLKYVRTFFAIFDTPLPHIITFRGCHD